jgi:hypothetical protein
MDVSSYLHYRNRKMRRTAGVLALAMAASSVGALSMGLAAPHHAVRPFCYQSLASSRLRTPPAPAARFGMSEREMRRLSLMRGVDEPLQEEIEGLIVLGGVVGLATGGPLFRSPLLGMILGLQLSPLLAFTTGPRGDRLRAAGWDAHVRWRQAVKRAREGWATILTESERRGLTRRLVALRRRASEWNERVGLSARAGEWAAACWAGVLTAWAAVRRWSCRVGLTARLQALWRRTGVPTFVKESRDRAMLNARMRDIAEREIRDARGRGPDLGI